METHMISEPEPTNTPASAWIRFLRSYGPTPNNLNLFDEYVTAALHRAKVKPISLPSPFLEEMKHKVTSRECGSILLAIESVNCCKKSGGG